MVREKADQQFQEGKGAPQCQVQWGSQEGIRLTTGSGIPLGLGGFSDGTTLDLIKGAEEHTAGEHAQTPPWPSLSTNSMFKKNTESDS